MQLVRRYSGCTVICRVSTKAQKDNAGHFSNDTQLSAADGMALIKESRSLCCNFTAGEFSTLHLFPPYILLKPRGMLDHMVQEAGMLALKTGPAAKLYSLLDESRGVLAAFCVIQYMYLLDLEQNSQILPLDPEESSQIVFP